MQPITTEIVSRTIIKRPADSHKGNYGRIMLIGGNQNFGGAIIMAATAATYSGAGLVTVATDPSNFTSLPARLPEAMRTGLPYYYGHHFFSVTSYNL